MKHRKPRILRNRARKSPKQLLGHAAKGFAEAARKSAVAAEALRILYSAGAVLVDKLQSLSFTAKTH